MAHVYILRCADGSLYTGSAKDLCARLEVHNTGCASRYTRSRLPVELVWSREVATWSQALSEEHRIKKLTRKEKLRLIASGAGRSDGVE